MIGCLTNFELQASGIQNQNPLRNGIHSRGYLPHVKRGDADYFVTFRLADSLPKEVLLRLEGERAQRMRLLLEAKREARAADDTEENLNRDFRREVERYLDRGGGACHLRRPEMGALVADALKQFDGTRYILREWVVMPNHVHALVRPIGTALIGQIVKSWKQFTALRANRMLQLSERRFWQPESYGHWVRDDSERERIIRYIRNNPVIGRLCTHPEHWRWSSAWREPK